MTNDHSLEAPGVDPFSVARAAADAIAQATGVQSHDVALVLGSGWGASASKIGPTMAEVDQSTLPGFRPAAVAGHSSVLRSIAIGDTGQRALVFGTRTHFYEGHGVRAVVHAVRTAAAAGCRVVILTNGCGSVEPSWGPGTVALIRDHINLTAASPLEGATFVDLTDLYSPALRDIARSADPTLVEGVYVQFRGPHYETPAEVRMAGIMGGHLVGMSTTLEAIAARHAGLDVLGLSLVTNLGAGVGEAPLDHSEVIEAGADASERCGQLLSDIVHRIAEGGRP